MVFLLPEPICKLVYLEWCWRSDYFKSWAR